MTATKTMSSLEIAELTGKEHAHVRRDIYLMLTALAEDVSKFGDIYRDRYGREQSCYRLPKDLCFTLVAGYSAPLRHKIVTRWIELERKEFEGALRSQASESLIDIQPPKLVRVEPPRKPLEDF